MSSNPRTPLRRSSSKGKNSRKETSPGKLSIKPKQLFDLCVEYILQSNEVAGKAVVHLPPVHAQYLLCLGLKRLREGTLSSSSILHKLITGWPYSELSFNFRSNPLVIKRLGSLQPVGHSWSFGCVEPHVYHNICGLSKSRYSSCSREIAIGLFNHIYRHDQFMAGSGVGGQLPLQSVDLSDFEQFSAEIGTSFLDKEPTVAPFYQLTRGIFPGRDAYECLSPEDFKFYRSKKPTLSQHSSHHSSVKLFVNFKFTTVSQLMEFTRLPRGPTRYKLYLKALDIGLMEKNSSMILQKQLDELDNTELKTLITRSNNPLSDTFLAKVSYLWVLQDDPADVSLIRQALKLSGNLETLFVSLLSFESCLSVLEVIGECTSNGHSISSLGLFGGETKRSVGLIGSCLTRLSSSLKYLQLHDWTPSSIPLKSLLACHQLCVVSIIVDCSHLSSYSSKSHTIGELFETLGQLKKLEFIELGEQVDLQAPDLVRIQTTLRSSLRSLQHCHLSFNYISLKRADLDEAFNQPIYQLIRSFFMIVSRGSSSLLYRQAENFHLTLHSSALSLTKKWLTDNRRNVCFKIGAETNSVSSLVHLRRLGM